jgi:glycogen debranching enzyme
MKSDAQPDAPFSLAGEQALVTGTERVGIQDIWIHPLGVVSGGLQMNVAGVACEAVRFEISPGQVVRDMEFGGVRIVERIVPSRRAPFVVIEYRTQSGDKLPGGAVIRGALPLRLQWPMPASLLQPLRSQMASDVMGNHHLALYSADGLSGASVEISGARTVKVHSDDRCPTIEIDASESSHVRLLIHRLRAPLSRATALPPDAEEIAAAAEGRRSHSQALSAHATEFESPDAGLDHAFAWAKQRLSMFVAESPGVGRGLMAGYATSRAGWGVSRAGYSWFFGRDACWTGDALLAAGMHEEAFAALEFLANSRDITGKIMHEATTSGVVHYDAADATPLFLRFAAAFAEWTADRSCLHAIWPAVSEGVAYVASTDVTGEGLPENTGIGHGWLEMGPLGGGAVTAYVAAVWIDALRRIGPVAEWLGDAGLAATCGQLLAKARAALELRLRHPATGRLALQLMADGSRIDDLTALSAVPIALGVDEHPSADEVVRELGSLRFCAPWGVRLLSVDDPRYRPEE